MINKLDYNYFYLILLFVFPWQLFSTNFSYDLNNSIAKILDESGISLVSDLLDSDMDSLLELKDIDEQALDSIYESVQNYVERKIEPEKEEDEIDLSSLGIELEDNRDSGSDLEKSISEEE